MAGTLDWGSVTFTAELVRNMKDALLIDGLLSDRFNSMHTIQTNIKAAKEILYFGEMTGLVGKTSTNNCTPNVHTNTIPATNKFWAPGYWDARFTECADNLKATAMIYATKNKINFNDLTDTDWADLFMNRLSNPIQMAYWRTSWFGNKTATNFNGSPAGDITNAISVTYLNMIDGFFKQLITAVSSLTDQHIDIPANDQTTYATQLSALTPLLAYTYMSNIKYSAPIYARNIPNGQILCTQTIYDKVEQYYIGQGIESMFTNMQSGVKQLMVNGIPLVAVPEWDYIINQIHNNGTKWIYPHRAVYTSKDNLVIGTSADINEVNTLDMFYDKKDKAVYVDFAEETDAKVIFDNKFMLAI